MATETKKGFSHKYLMHVIIMIAITFAFRLIPPPGTVTPYGMAVIGVFVGLIYGWTFLGLLFPSLFGSLALATTGYGSVTAVWTAMFTNSTTLMMLVGVLAFAAIQYTGAGDWIIGGLLGSKLAKKSPIMVVEMFMLCWMLGMIIGIAWFLMFGVLQMFSATLLKCGYEKGDRFNFFVLGGCIIAGQIGQSFLPFMGWGIMITGTMMQVTQTMLNYNAWMFLEIIIAIIYLITWPIFMKICGCDFSKLANVDIDSVFPRKGGLDSAQKLSIISVLVFILVTVLTTAFNGKIAIFTYINNNIGILGLMVFLWVYVVAHKINDKPILDMKQAGAGFSWDMLLLIAFALLISSVLTSSETGISSWIASILMPLFSGNLIMFYVILAAATIILTNLANNIAICFIMMNLVGAMYQNGFAVNLVSAALIISLCSTFIAFLTPASSINGALLHADESCSSGTIYKFTPIMILYGILLLMVVLLPYSLIF